jgi:hypothetical protein
MARSGNSIPDLPSSSLPYLSNPSSLSPIPILLRTPWSYAFVLSIAVMRLPRRKAGTSRFMAQISRKPAIPSVHVDIDAPKSRVQVYDGDVFFT